MNEVKTGMPYNLEAEQSLLGCMLMDNEILANVLEVLAESDFYVESHKIIYNAIKTVYNARKAVDFVTVSDALEKSCNITSAGGTSYLIDLAQAIPSAANYLNYMEIVRRDGAHRRLIRAAGEIIERARTSDDASDTMRYAEERLYGIAQNRERTTSENIGETGFFDVLDYFNTIQTDKDALRGVMTGFFRLDKITNGLQKSNLIVLAARPGMGKTSFAMNIIEHAGLYGGKVCAVFSLEMSIKEIKQRLLCSTAGVSMQKSLSGHLNDEEWRKLSIVNNRFMDNAKIEVDDNPNITPAEILSKCRRIKARNGGRLDLVMIDYIQLMSSGKRYGEQNRTQEVADITRALKLMAKELNVPVLALSQLRRIQTGEPQLSDLRESGAIEQDADIVMFINRPDVGATPEDMQKKNIVKGSAILNIAKHRNGELARLPLRFNGDIVKFIDAERE